MPKVFLVAGETFKTKKALTERVQSIIAAYKDGVSLNRVDSQFVLSLLEFHPNSEIKIGVGVESFRIEENPVYPGRRSRGFVLTRIDGTSTDFSYRECISPSSQIKKVKSAFRQAIQSQIFQFKRHFFDTNGPSAICPDTGETLSFVGSHVDHVAPLTFEKLMSDFVSAEGLDVEEIALGDELQDNKYVDTLQDKWLEDRWSAYHYKYAVLEVVSQNANLSARRHK